MSLDQPPDTTALIGEWRAFLDDRGELEPDDVAELEDHLRSEMADLADSGLSAQEAFLVAVQRLGAIDAISHEFGREYTGRLWKQLTVSPADGEGRQRLLTAGGLAVAAALIVQITRVVPESVALRTATLFVFPVVAAYFGITRRASARTWVTGAALFAVTALAAAAYPLSVDSDSVILVGIHVPIVAWLIVGYAFVAGEWRSQESRMDFIRFTGEWFVYFVLIGLGGGVLIGVSIAVFDAVGLPVDEIFGEWILPSGAAGAAVVAAWLVDTKKSVVENIAPVLAQVFTPLFAIALVVFVIATALAGNLTEVDRTVLIAFDLLLVVILGLLLYNVSARDPLKPAGAADFIQLTLLVSALIADLFMLTAMVSRISEFGFSVNKVAALGENLVLFVNLAWAAVLGLRFRKGRSTFAAIERWQTNYLPVFAAWALLVIVVLPPLFEFA